MLVSDLAQTIFSHRNKNKLLQRAINTKSVQHFALPKGFLKMICDHKR